MALRRIDYENFNKTEKVDRIKMDPQCREDKIHRKGVKSCRLKKLRGRDLAHEVTLPGVQKAEMLPRE